jgi:phosphoglycerate dehydrogenase-like enzyme
MVGTPNAPVDVLITIPFSEQLINRLREVSPRLRLQMQPVRKAEEIPPELWGRAEILYTDRLLPTPEQVPNLRWVQFHFAGIDFATDSALLQDRDLLVTTLSGAAASQMAEYALMMLLALGHHLPDLISSQARAEWPRDRFDRFRPRELRGSTVGLVGYGSIGRQIARLLQPFGVTILAAKRDVMHPEDTGYIQDGMGDPGGDYFLRLYPIQALRSMLGECDFVVVSIPLTPQTQDLMGFEEFAAMKPGAFLVDISRGSVVNQAALLSALQEKRLAGVALDVFAEEPLPPNHPLWKHPNVMVSPHIAGNSAHYNDRAVALFAENLSRYLAGLPLYNQFDRQKGY